MCWKDCHEIASSSSSVDDADDDDDEYVDDQACWSNCCSLLTGELEMVRAKMKMKLKMKVKLRRQTALWGQISAVVPFFAA